MLNPLNKLIEPWYPATAVGLEQGTAAMVQLESRRGNAFALRRAASIALPDSMIRPGFDDPNIAVLAQLAEVLRELATSAGLLRQRKWSVALPEASMRTLILTLETQAGSKGELEDVLKWKTERGFGAPLEELSISKQSLPRDSQGRERYLAVAVRLAVLAEYESVFGALGWRAGLILPRNLGEGCWLTRNGSQGDSLLVTTHEDGFTAAIFRDHQPIILRTIVCDADEREDEFYRLLLFYRDRRSSEAVKGAPQSLERMLIVGKGF